MSRSLQKELLRQELLETDLSDSELELGEFFFCRGDRLSSSAAEKLQELYEKSSGAKNSGVDLEQYLRSGLSPWVMDLGGSWLIGHKVNGTLLVSHFCPMSKPRGVASLRRAASSRKLVFAVPDNLASQLARLGFQDTGMQVPQFFRGELVIKEVITSRMVSESDLSEIGETISL